MKSKPDENDNEINLEKIARRLLTTPHSRRDESKAGKSTARVEESPKPKKKPSR